ncbi:MAG: hypothetical protein GQ523_01220 [Methanophagales archaeon]|nr:hypothetical protein [Methanophagales archaeon]
MRQDMWVKGRKLTKKEKKNKQWKREFYDFYQWLLRHCQKADCASSRLSVMAICK